MTGGRVYLCSLVRATLQTRGATGGGRQVKHSGVQAPGQEALEKLLCLLYIFCTHTHHVIYFETVLLKDKRGHIENSKHLFE